MVSKFCILKRLLGLSLFGLGACAADVDIASLPCEQIVGAESVLASEGPDIIVIGEMHGMTKPPAFVEALTCRSLRDGYKTVLALEISDKDGRLDSYLNSDGGETAREALLEAQMWTTGFTDGRSSEAMLDLIETARVWISQGYDISVTPFATMDINGEDFETKSDLAAAYEKMLADNILAGAKAGQKTIVLVGNIHARHGAIVFGDLNYDAMAEHLPRANTLSFNMIAMSGTGWNCQGEPIICQENIFKGQLGLNHPLAQDGRFRILSKDEIGGTKFPKLRLDPEFYDGLVFVGPAKASPPANAENRKALNIE